MGSAGLGPRKLHEFSPTASHARQFEREGSSHVAADRNDGSLLLDHDGVAGAEADARKRAFTQEIVKVGAGDHLARPQHTDASIAAARGIDAACALQIDDEGVVRGAGKAPGWSTGPVTSTRVEAVVTGAA